VIPNYNHGHVIGAAIAAFAKQSLPPDEIIVVDDGSSDDSLSILTQLTNRYSMLRIIALEANHGAVGAMNHGLHAASGTYVNFAGADDLTHPGLLASAVSCLERNPSVAFACTEGLAVDEGERGGVGFRPPILPSFVEASFPPTQAAELLRTMDNLFLTGSAVIRRDLLIAAGGFDPTLRSFADGLLLRQLALRFGFCFIPYLGITWQISASGFSRSEANRVEQSLGIMQEALSRMRPNADFPTWYPEVFERRWRFGLGRVAVGANPMNKSTLLRLARSSLAAGIFKIAGRLGGRAGKYLALACLVVQERPMSLIGLLRTALFRRRRVKQSLGGRIEPRAVTLLDS
jgi:glycosyltransferase involved in cell wall biosynthesis